MATHATILGILWRIPWTEEPGGLPVHSVTKSQTRLKQLSVHVHQEGRTSFVDKVVFEMSLQGCKWSPGDMTDEHFQLAG